jgi:hypothetical protein
MAKVETEAKEVKAEKKTEAAKVEKYYLTEKVRNSGYFAEVDGQKFYVSRATKEMGRDAETGDPKKMVVLGVVEELKRIETINGYDSVLKATDKTYFENLTFNQIKTLLNAGVIQLNKEQSAKYKKDLNAFYEKIHAYRNTDR